MGKNQIYKAFQQEHYQIEERLKRFKEEVGGEGFSCSWNDLTDKPFGEEKAESQTVLFEGSITSCEDLYEKFKLTDSYLNKKFVITFDGETYEGVYEVRDYGDGPPVYAIWDEEKGFRLANVYDGYYGYNLQINNSWFEFKEGKKYAIKIEVVEEVINIKTLDDKYISENIARVSDVEAAVEGHVVSWNDLIDKPFGEVTETVTPTEEYEINSENLDDVTTNEFMILNEYILPKFSEKNIRVTLKGKEFTGTVIKSSHEEDFGDGDIVTINNYYFDDGDFHWFNSGEDGIDRITYPNHGLSEEDTYILKVEVLEEQEVTKTKTLDDKYISDNIARVSDIIDNWDDLANKPFYQEGKVIKQLDDKYISNNIARVSDVESIVENHTISWNNLADKPFKEEFIESTEKTLLQTITQVSSEYGKIQSTVNFTIDPAFAYYARYSDYGEEFTKRLEMKDNNGILSLHGSFPYAAIDIQNGALVASVEPDCRYTFYLEKAALIPEIHTLDDKYISDNIARTSQIPSKTSDLENDSNYISKAELQNILNQITVTTAEDGTISLNIPTIS